MQKAIIIQLEGVLSDDSKRRHLIEPELPIKGHISPGVCRECGEYKDECVCPLPIKKPDYAAYHAAADQDGVNSWCLDILYAMLNERRTQWVFVSDTPEKYRKETEDWMLRYCDILIGLEPWAKLFMRPDFLPSYIEVTPTSLICDEIVVIDKNGNLKLAPDSRPYAEIKREIYEKSIRDQYDVLFVLDRDEEPWKELGVQVLKVI